MRTAAFVGSRPGRVVRRLALLAAVSAAAGCSGGDYGTVASTPKSAPEVVQVDAPKKGAAAPRVPRGPAQAKALREAAAK